jgi:hypothetical protein
MIVNDPRFAGRAGVEVRPGCVAIEVNIDPNDVTTPPIGTPPVT